MALRKPGATEIADAKAMPTVDLGLDSSPPSRTAPRRSLAIRNPAPRAAAPSGPAVIIVQGDTRTSVPVASESAAL